MVVGGISDTFPFNRALIIKISFEGYVGNCIWSHIIIEKYMSGKDFTIWIRDGAKRKTCASYIWGSVMKNIQWLLNFLRWDVGDGTQVEIDLNAVKGFSGNHTLSVPLLDFLCDKGIFYLNQFHKMRNNFSIFHSWLKEVELGLHGNLAVEWGIVLYCWYLSF